MILSSIIFFVFAHVTVNKKIRTLSSLKRKMAHL